MPESPAISGIAGGVGRKAVTLVTVSWAILMARWYWRNRQLDKKIDKKRKQCRQTLEKVEKELQKNKLPARQKEAILSLSLSTLQSKLRSGELKAVDVLRAYQEQALEVNVKINCLTEAITDAQELAAACDESGDKTRLLHGIPVSLKENIGVKGYDRTGGLQINIGVPCDKDAVITQVLKRHGAIPFVRTNIPQAMLSYTCSNPIFGRTANPHNVLHTPGGSSGGEGAIIGAGGSIIGIGSDVGGSVRVPASFCGCCSLKPTLGRFSKMGFYTVTKGQTQISGVPGPMAGDVDSLVVLTRVLSSPDMFQLDASLPPLPFQQQLLNSTHRLRIGYYTWDGNLPPVPVVSRAVREAKKALEDLGHTLVEFSPMDYSQKFAELFIGTMLGADQGQTLRSKVKDDYLDGGLKLIKMTLLPRWLLSLLAKMISLKEPVLSRAVAHFKKEGRTYDWFCHVVKIQEYREKFTEQWKSLDLDAVICSAFPSPAPRTCDVGRLTTGGSNLALYNLVNFPAGVLPVTKVTSQDVADANNPALFPARTSLERLLKKSCDTEDCVGLPVGVQCVTLPFKEELCLRVMRELETAVNYKGL